MINLLIVDDNAKMRRMLRSVVADLAGVVRECSGGAEALAAYAEQRPDFVLMDLAMDGLDGLAATAQIVITDPTAKIIIVTSYDATDLRRAADEAGASGYVLKENLLDVRRLLLSASGKR